MIYIMKRVIYKGNTLYLFFSTYTYVWSDMNGVIEPNAVRIRKGEW